MWSRPAAAAGLLLALAAFCPAQQSKVFTPAVPPDKDALQRLNLRTEWTVYLPVDGRRDTIELVQTFDDQLFVQTRTGLLITVDARTGKILWSAALGQGEYGNVYPVAVNSQFVFVAHITRLFAFYRYSGVVEFAADLGTPPTAGLAADDTGIYATLTTRPGAAGGERLVAYDLPRPIALLDPTRVAASKPTDRDKAINPVDELTRRYPVDGAVRTVQSDAPVADIPARGNLREIPVGGMSGSKTPSLAVTQRVTPPYTKDGAEHTPSLVVIPSLRRPYHLRDETGGGLQRTPSIGTIPPSVAASLALTNLRPRGVEPRIRWEYGLTTGANFRPTLSPQRVWIATDNRGLMALSKADKTIEVADQLSDQVSAPLGQAGTTGYVPLADGSLMAIDLVTGNLVGGVNVIWRTNAGGLMNHRPLVTEDAVYAAGDNSGVVRIERATGALTWRTDRAADRVVAVNLDFAYIQDRQGRLHVYDVRRATSPTPPRTVPLAGIDLPAFNVPVENTVSDRIYLAAGNGLMVCLRDASPKYAAPVRMAPEVIVNPPARTGVEGAKGPTPPTDVTPAPKKDEVPPKKDEAPPKKDVAPPKKDVAPPKKND
ncbi:MAG: hypothetical protein JWO38_5187 [Gemmataceae bacterium]|nr:hypothetical protein [Gemmataceae bacterium]